MKSFLKTILTAIAILAGGVLLPLRAETVTQKQAVKLAQQFFNEANGRVMAPVKLIYNGRRLTTDRLFIPFYIYNLPSGGFVIISAENKTFPILGFSLKDKFDPDKIGPKTKAILSAYAKDIEMVRYSSEVPQRAISAWQDFPKYVRSILDAPYAATDPLISIEEASNRIDYLIRSGKADETASDIFSPAQWESLINDELAANKSVAFALITPPAKVDAAVIHGRKGDFYRIELDSRNSWLMRLLPTEILSGSQLADFSFPVEVPLPPDDQPPFYFLDSYVHDDPAEAMPTNEYSRMIENLADGQPVVKGIGGGHYEIVLPENIRMMSIFNLSGATCSISTFKSTNVAHADLSIEPSGFYFAQIIGESGTPYGIKLIR